MLAFLKSFFAPRPAPTAWLYRVEYDVTSTLPQLLSSLKAGRPAMYRFNSGNYMAVSKAVLQFMEKSFGADSPERNAVLPSPIVCEKCTTLFPETWKVHAALGGGGAPCPGCGGASALLVLTVYRPEEITEKDVAALAEYWESKGEDAESVQARLEGALEKLKENPSRFGMQELWLARNFASQKAADAAAPNREQLEAMFVNLMLKKTMEFVVAEKMGGQKLSEKDRYNRVMNFVHSELNKTLPKPLTNEQFDELKNSQPVLGG